jgi:heat shock protein HslJ
MKTKPTTNASGLFLAIAVLLVACGQGVQEDATPSETEETSGDSPRTSAPPTVEELAQASFPGIMDESVQLTDGTWHGDPFVEGGVSAPAVGLVERFYLAGDLTGDGNQEAVVLLWSSSGGSGTFDYLAVTRHSAEGVVSLATAELGDRVQVRAGRIHEGRIELEVVQTGPEDAACCPTELAKRTWQMGPDGLTESEPQVTGTLSLAELRGPEWVLTDFAWDEPAPGEPEVTLTFGEGEIAGRGGCNNYFGGVEETGETPNGISIGHLGSTRMMCPEPIMAVEDRFFRQLAGITSYSFLAGHLALSWQGDQEGGVMLFRPREKTAEDS